MGSYKEGARLIILDHSTFFRVLITHIPLLASSIRVFTFVLTGSRAIQLLDGSSEDLDTLPCGFDHLPPRHGRHRCFRSPHFASRLADSNQLVGGGCSLAVSAFDYRSGCCDVNVFLNERHYLSLFTGLLFWDMCCIRYVALSLSLSPLI